MWKTTALLAAITSVSAMPARIASAQKLFQKACAAATESADALAGVQGAGGADGRVPHDDAEREQAEQQHERGELEHARGDRRGALVR